MSKDTLLTGRILKHHGWPDGKIIGIAKDVVGLVMDIIKPKKDFKQKFSPPNPMEEEERSTYKMKMWEL